MNVRTSLLIGILGFAVAASEGASGAPAPAPSYKITHTTMLGAPDRWDYVTYDAGSHRVYVAHGDRVSVVDGGNGSIVGEVLGMPGGTHGIGISAATEQGFTDDGSGALAVPFDLTSLKAKAHVAVGADADGILVDPESGHVFVVGGDPGTLSVIDPKTDQVIATIEGGGKLEFAVADGQGHVYVDGEANHDIVRIDTKTNEVDAHWAMPDCRSPHGLAIDEATHRLFAGCANKSLTVMNADTGAIVATVPIGAGSDGVVFDPKRKLVFSANGRDGTLSVIREQPDGTFASVATIPTAVSARTLSIDPDSGRLFLVAADLEPVGPDGKRPKARPGSVRLMFLDPQT